MWGVREWRCKDGLGSRSRAIETRHCLDLEVDSVRVVFLSARVLEDSAWVVVHGRS